MVDSYYSVMGSDGGLERYPDPYARVDQDEVTLAMEAESSLIDEKRKVSRSFIKMAYLLDLVDEQKLYLARGFPNLQTWASSPELDLSYRMTYDLLRIKRELIPILTEQLGDESQAIQVAADAGISNVRALLPLIREGEKEAIAELGEAAKHLTYRDLVAEVKAITSKQEEEIDKRYPAVFHATVRQGETHTRMEISVSDGVAIEPCGTLTIRNEYMSRWEKRFGEFVRVKEGR